MVQDRSGFVHHIIVPLRYGRLRFATVLIVVALLEYSGWRLLGASGCGLVVPVSQRLLSAAWLGQYSELRLPQAESDGPHWRIDGKELQQFWQMPWAICFCVSGSSPQWLFCDEVDRGVFVQCCREAHLALQANSTKTST